MTSLIDGIKLAKLADHYQSRLENVLAYKAECARLGVKDKSAMACESGCGSKCLGGGLCPDCLRLVADTLRDAAARADK